mmetsp:Transcript_14347/g.49624  ORF Transcript_14347/g.49624 Transcript_14347/m.49624 type:complete len:161 (+) Transcript_14347:24-506(+)
MRGIRLPHSAVPSIIYGHGSGVRRYLAAAAALPAAPSWRRRVVQAASSSDSDEIAYATSACTAPRAATRAARGGDAGGVGGGVPSAIFCGTGVGGRSRTDLSGGDGESWGSGGLAAYVGRTAQKAFCAVVGSWGSGGPACAPPASASSFAAKRARRTRSS